MRRHFSEITVGNNWDIWAFSNWVFDGGRWWREKCLIEHIELSREVLFKQFCELEINPFSGWRFNRIDCWSSFSWFKLERETILRVNSNRI